MTKPVAIESQINNAIAISLFPSLCHKSPPQAANERHHV
jgi:hypothetical protein